MTRTGKVLMIGMVAAVTQGVAAGSGPVLKSNAAAVQLRAAVQERLSLVSGTPLVEFPVQQHRWLARGDRPVSFTTSWNLERTRTAVVVSAFFEDAKGALKAIGSSAEAEPIASEDVWGRASTGTFTPFSAAVSWPGRGIELFRQPLNPGVNDMASRTDELELEIDLTRRALLVGNYEGVLTLVAEAY
jgi:hypothetical protein